MVKIEKKNLGSPEETRTFDKGKVDLGTVGGTTFGRAVFEPGWKWSESLKPVVNTESCEMPHTAYVISGKMAVKMDGEEETELGPGDVAHIPSGHDAWVVGDEACVMIDVTGAKDYAKKE